MATRDNSSPADYSGGGGEMAGWGMPQTTGGGTWNLSMFPGTPLSIPFQPILGGVSDLTGSTPNDPNTGNYAGSSDAEKALAQAKAAAAAQQGGGMGGLNGGDVYQGMDPSLYQLPGYQQLTGDMRSYMDQIQGRVAPQIGPAQFSPYASAQGVTLGGAQQATAPTLGPAAQAGPAQFGPAAVARASSGGAGHASNVTIDPYQRAQLAQVPTAQQAATSDVRNRQVEAMNYQHGLMTGDNSVAKIQFARQRAEQAAQLSSMAASARPGQGGMARRVATQTSGMMGAELASREAEATQAERNAGAASFGQYAAGVRGQDESLGMFNTDQTNQSGRLGASLAQGAYNLDAQQAAARATAQGQLTGNIHMSNADLATRASIANAGYGTQASIANAQGANSLNIARGQTNANIGMFNTGEQNTNNRFGADLAGRVGMFNADQGNTMQRAQGDIDARMNMFNAQGQNAYNSDVTHTGVDVAGRNADLTLRNNSQMDQGMYAGFTGLGNLAGAQQKGNVDYANSREDRYKQAYDWQNKWKMYKDSKPSDMDKILGVGMGLAQLGAMGGFGSKSQPQPSYGNMGSTGQDFFNGGAGGGSGGDYALNMDSPTMGDVGSNFAGGAAQGYGGGAYQGPGSYGVFSDPGANYFAGDPSQYYYGMNPAQQSRGF